MKAIMNTRANIFIIILLVVKKLRMTMRIMNGSKIIIINQIKKNVISIVKDAPLSIQDARVPVSLLVIDIPEDNLLLGID